MGWNAQGSTKGFGQLRRRQQGLCLSLTAIGLESSHPLPKHSATFKTVHRYPALIATISSSWSHGLCPAITSSLAAWKPWHREAGSTLRQMRSKSTWNYWKLDLAPYDIGMAQPAIFSNYKHGWQIYVVDSLFVLSYCIALLMLVGFCLSIKSLLAQGN